MSHAKIIIRMNENLFWIGGKQIRNACALKMSTSTIFLSLSGEAKSLRQVSGKKNFCLLSVACFYS